MKRNRYQALLLSSVLIIFIYLFDFKYLYASSIVVIIYLNLLPDNIFNPKNMVFAFFSLYMVLPSTLYFILNMVGYDYQLPWGQIVYWDDYSHVLYFQTLFVYVVLMYSFDINIKRLFVKVTNYKVLNTRLILLCLLSMALIFIFISMAGGINQWVGDYSKNFLSGRRGLGVLNFVLIAITNVTIYLLGLKYYNKKSSALLLVSIVIILTTSFVGGFKSRLIFLIIVFFFPFLRNVRFKFYHIITLTFVFICLLYLTTLVRTQGFYGSSSFFMEYMIGYFNSYELHWRVINDMDPGFFETQWMSFTKIFQTLGFVGPDVDYDISIWLTKIYFPNQWYLEYATQQWPLDTELYLNYFTYLGIIPLLIYSRLLSTLYNWAFVLGNKHWQLIYLFEFLRLFSTLRGQLIPWEFPVILISYLLYYVSLKKLVFE